MLYYEEDALPRRQLFWGINASDLCKAALDGTVPDLSAQIASLVRLQSIEVKIPRSNIYDEEGLGRQVQNCFGISSWSIQKIRR